MKYVLFSGGLDDSCIILDDCVSGYEEKIRNFAAKQLTKR